MHIVYFTLHLLIRLHAKSSRLITHPTYDMLQHHRSPNLVPPMQTDTNMLIKVHTQINCVLMQGKSQMTWISPLPRPFYQSPNLIYTTHTHVQKCPWYHIVLRQKAVIGRQALWSHPRWVFIAKVKDRCCVWWLASGWRLMVSLICRIISEKRVRRCRFGAYYCVCVCVCLQHWCRVVSVCAQVHVCVGGNTSAGTEPSANKELWAWSEQHLLKHQMLRFS